jgi:hypothetical protein
MELYLHSPHSLPWWLNTEMLYPYFIATMSYQLSHIFQEGSTCASGHVHPPICLMRVSSLKLFGCQGKLVLAVYDNSRSNFH